MNNYFLDQNIQNAFNTLHEYWIKNYLNATLTIEKQTTITDNSGIYTVIRPKKTTTRREKIGSKIDKYLLESIIVAILLPFSTNEKTIQEILSIDKNLSYGRQLKLYGCLGEIIEDIKLMKKTISKIQAKILGIIQLDVSRDFMDSDVSSDCVLFALFYARKSYHASKLAEFLRANKVNIRSAIDKKMESFEMNKDHIIKSVLKHSFYKVVLDYLVVNNELILEPEIVKSKIDTIMENWTRKCQYHQYQPLEHVFNGAFSGVMCLVEFDELFSVVFDLSNGKTVGLLDVSNELWKYYDKSVLNMLLGTTTQFPIFAIGSIVEDALEKNRELWLVLQNMQKAYDLVG
ncbi:hypothetical protein G9A89_015763 [Geosiphon pyriformis]|nr:hypothetical protein G9A89_015763 [Geosiphon pyriformis]